MCLKSKDISFGLASYMVKSEKNRGEWYYKICFILPKIDERMLETNPTIKSMNSVMASWYLSPTAKIPIGKIQVTVGNDAR